MLTEQIKEILAKIDELQGNLCGTLTTEQYEFAKKLIDSATDYLELLKEKLTEGW